MDFAFEEVVLEAAEVARLLGDGLGGDSVVRGIDCSVDSIQEVMVRGSGEMWKVGATCSGLAWEEIRVVSSFVERCMSLDRESATSFASPGMCSENKVASYLNSSFVKYRASLSWCGCLMGLNVEWNIHPSALLLSVNAKMCGCWLLCLSRSRDTSIFTMAPMNSSTLIEARPLSLRGITYCHALPCMVVPPNPHVQASE